MSTCLSCDAGKFQRKQSQSACSNCQPGQVSIWQRGRLKHPTILSFLVWMFAQLVVHSLYDEVDEFVDNVVTNFCGSAPTGLELLWAARTAQQANTPQC